MAELKVEVGLTVPIETVNRCLRILEMWMNDNPDKSILASRTTPDSPIRLSIEFVSWNKKEENDGRGPQV